MTADTFAPFAYYRHLKMVQGFLAWTALYGLSVAMSKLAILLLYIRIFTTHNNSFYIVSYTVGFVIGVVGIINMLNVVFQCSPINNAWDKSMQHGSCIDELVFARYMAIPNVATGAIMLAMPVPMVWRLKITTQLKIALILTFLHGIMYDHSYQSLFMRFLRLNIRISGLVASSARLAILWQPTSMTNMNGIYICIWIDSPYS